MSQVIEKLNIIIYIKYNLGLQRVTGKINIPLSFFFCYGQLSLLGKSAHPRMRNIIKLIELKLCFRCYLFGVLHGGISSKTPRPQSAYKWSDLTNNSYHDSRRSEIPTITCRSPTSPAGQVSVNVYTPYSQS